MGRSRGISDNLIILVMQFATLVDIARKKAVFL